MPIKKYVIDQRFSDISNSSVLQAYSMHTKLNPAEVVLVYSPEDIVGLDNLYRLPKCDTPDEYKITFERLAKN
jgi:hypothetical protein